MRYGFWSSIAVLAYSSIVMAILIALSGCGVAVSMGNDVSIEKKFTCVQEESVEICTKGSVTCYGYAFGGIDCYNNNIDGKGAL